MRDAPVSPFAGAPGREEGGVAAVPHSPGAPGGPENPGGHEYPPGESAPGGYHYPNVRPPPPESPEPAPEEDDPLGPADPDAPPVAAERFRRDTPARAKTLLPARSRGQWRLIAVTVLFVMFMGSWAEHLSPGARAAGHLVFWAGVATAAFVTFHREWRNGWESSARWPWPAAALAGSLVAEVLILTVGPSTVVVGSVIVLALGLFLLLFFG